MIDNPNDFWSNRYKQEREIWLNEPSLTAKFLEQVIPLKAKIFEIGFGYGRDAFYLASKGFDVQGIEQSIEGYRMAQEQVCSGKYSNPPSLLLGDFLKANLHHQAFDAVYSHRVAHLFTQEEQVEQYVRQVASIIKEGGYLLTSARDSRGQKPSRPGHHVNFWNEQRFSDTFGKQFQIQSFLQGQEIESANNPVPTFFTLMIAQRRPIV